MPCRILAIEYYLPDNKLNNDDIAKTTDRFNGEKIARKTGILSRHVSANNEYVSDMATLACEKIFSSGGCRKEDVDFLILCTQSADYKLPTTACLVQERLHLRNDMGAYDINLGCSGFVYALGTAKGLIAGKLARNVLLVMSETYSKYIHPKDYGTRTIFGDGAAAILVSESDTERVGEFVFGTDGSGACELIVPAGGAKTPISLETAKEYTDNTGTRTLENLYMNGPNVFMFSIDIIGEIYRRLLELYHCKDSDIDIIIPHQANKFILECAMEQYDFLKGKLYINMADIGNTVSASIPIAMKMAEAEGRLQRGNRVMLIGFGVGYSWAGTIITY